MAWGINLLVLHADTIIYLEISGLGHTCT